MVAFPIHIRPWMISEHLKKSKPILDLYVSNRNKARLVEGHVSIQPASMTQVRSLWQELGWWNIAVFPHFLNDPVPHGYDCNSADLVQFSSSLVHVVVLPLHDCLVTLLVGFDFG